MSIQPVEVKRDENGLWTHPQYPYFGGREYIPDSEWQQWCTEHGITSKAVSFDGDAPDELTEKYWDDFDTNCSAWEPTKPADNAFLLSIHDTEEGPIAVFAIPARDAGGQ